MDTRSAPGRLRSLTSWLINQNAITARNLVAAHLAGAATRRYHYSMLAALDEFGPASQADLGRRCGLDRSDVTACVTDLAEREWIERAPDPVDKRRNIVRLTKAGLKQLRALDRVVADAQDELLEPLSAAERAQLNELLTRVADHHTATA
ncbi:MarR family winged helix-turn-helix transcriptional regulator [Actinokineospora xionganensis]|uniref:MarR family transcriptional regulator n=1 Tax=Actinokineospora xionganensis TaxID=2684470 RepID=A0ABR7L793_9PSEU|nr:MarR family transcriptional regulator [Actinokineospora xionganensis]MBC6448413.1 MarR family transcriptional regulator [Actinokineospora xionganensis]